MLERNYLLITEAMSGWDNRLRAQLSLLWAPRGIAIGLGAALLVALLARLLPLLERSTLLIISGAAAFVGFLVALLVVWISPHRPLAMARRFDREFGLREQMSTAIELAEGSLPVESGALARLQMGDAIESAQLVDPAEGLPMRLELRELGMVGIVLAALVAALLLPNPQSDVLAERQAVKAAIAEELERLEALREQVAQDPSLSDVQRETIVNTLDAAIVSLERPDLSRLEAVAELTSAETRLRELSREEFEQANRAVQSLQGAGEMFSTPGLTEELGEALSQGDYEQASDLLKDLLDPEGVPLSHRVGGLLKLLR